MNYILLLTKAFATCYTSVGLLACPLYFDSYFLQYTKFIDKFFISF